MSEGEVTIKLDGALKGEYDLATAVFVEAQATRQARKDKHEKDVAKYKTELGELSRAVTDARRRVRAIVGKAVL